MSGDTDDSSDNNVFAANFGNFEYAFDEGKKILYFFWGKSVDQRKNSIEICQKVNPHIS